MLAIEVAAAPDNIAMDRTIPLEATPTQASDK